MACIPATLMRRKSQSLDRSYQMQDRNFGSSGIAHQVLQVSKSGCPTAQRTSNLIGCYASN